MFICHRMKKTEHQNLFLEVICIVCIMVNCWYFVCRATSEVLEGGGGLWVLCWLGATENVCYHNGKKTLIRGFRTGSYSKQKKKKLSRPVTSLKFKKLSVWREWLIRFEAISYKSTSAIVWENSDKRQQYPPFKKKFLGYKRWCNFEIHRLLHQLNEQS